MNGTTIKANVYYLPAAEAAVHPPAPSVWMRLRRRGLRTWWRARLSLADMRSGARRGRPSGGDDYTALLRSVIVDGRAELIERPRPKPARPAKIFDFEAARLRLRPATD